MKPLNNGEARTFSARPVPVLQRRHPQPSRLLVCLPLVQHPLKLLIDPVKIFVCGADLDLYPHHRLLRRLLLKPTCGEWRRSGPTAVFNHDDVHIAADPQGGSATLNALRPA